MNVNFLLAETFPCYVIKGARMLCCLTVAVYVNLSQNSQVVFLDYIIMSKAYTLYKYIIFKI